MTRTENILLRRVDKPTNKDELVAASIGSGTLGLLLSAVNTLATSEKLLLLQSNAKEEPSNSFL